jgi:hypothetical protein
VVGERQISFSVNPGGPAPVGAGNRQAQGPPARRQMSQTKPIFADVAPAIADWGLRIADSQQWQPGLRGIGWRTKPICAVHGLRMRIRATNEANLQRASGRRSEAGSVKRSQLPAEVGLEPRRWLCQTKPIGRARRL